MGAESVQAVENVEKKTKSPKPATWNVATILAFLAPVALMLAIFMGNGIFPFGKRCFLFSDMYHQYVPFFQEMMAKVKAGEGLSYSWNVGMGSNFLSLYVYYLASPLNWLAFLFPSKYLMEFMSYMVVVKIGLAGLCAYLYLRSREGDAGRKFSSVMALFCSVFYAMSGFVAAYNWNVMWMDCIVLLPLIVMGLERLVRQGKTGLYLVTLGLSIFSNFYISIMICIFLVLYFVYLFLAEGRRFSVILRFAAASLLAGGLAAVLLVPQVHALLATDFGDMDFPKKWESYFTVLDILARHCMGITTERALEHWPNIYCGSMVFMMIPLYAVNEKISARRRFGFLALAGIFLLSFGTNGLDFIWHGLNYPDSLPARQSFIYILIVLVMCYDCLTHLEGIRGKSIIKSYGAAVAVFLFIEKFVDSSDFMNWTWLLNLAFVTIYAIALYLYRTRGTWTVGFVAGMVVFVAVLTESAVNMALTSVGTNDRAAYLNHLEDYHCLYQRNAGGENGFNRFEKFTRKTKNDATLAGFPSASIFSSTMNSSVMDFYTALGMQHSKVYYGYDGATAFTSALLNVGYLFGESEEWENPAFRLVDQENGIYLYEAVYSLPFGYVAPKGFEFPEDNRDNGILLQNALVKQLGIEKPLLSKRWAKDAGDDVEYTPGEAGIYYGLVANSGTSKIKMTGGTPEEQNYKDLKKGGIIFMGYLEEQQEVLLTNGNDQDDTPNIVVHVYKLDLDVLEQAIAILKKQHMTDVKVDNTHVSGNLVLEEEGRLILSIPYEKGWTVLVNGEKREPEIFGGAFLALDLEPGTYEIQLDYVPSGSGMGLVITLISLGIVVGAVIVRRLRRKGFLRVSESDAQP